MTSRTWAQWLISRDGAVMHGMRSVVARHGRWAAWLVPGIYAGCIVAFIADLTSANTLAFGVFYAPLIATAVFHRDKHAVWVLTAIACAMNIIGAFFPTVDKDVYNLVGNRALSTLALLATAAFTWHARSIQEQLAEQTRRAESAERLKTEVLDNLSQEIRAPLHSMIGVLELAAANSRPEQRAALEMVRSSGRRLAMTVDNLVDLTQFEAASMPAEPMDLGKLLRRTAEARVHDASARQISLTINISADGDAIVHANPWAARRILENKIADAITYTAPGGRIEVSTDHRPGRLLSGDHHDRYVAARRVPDASDADGALLTPSVMGLALSQRLARAMNARLVFTSAPGAGTTVHLRLPAVARPSPEAPIAGAR